MNPGRPLLDIDPVDKRIPPRMLSEIAYTLGLLALYLKFVKSLYHGYLKNDYLCLV